MPRERRLATSAPANCLVNSVPDGQAASQRTPTMMRRTASSASLSSSHCWRDATFGKAIRASSTARAS